VTVTPPLEDKYEYLKCLLEYSSVPIIAWNRELEITLFNPAFERLTQRIADEVLGAPLDILFPEGTRDAAMEQIHVAVTGERWESAEISILCKDGSVRTVLWNSAPVFDIDGSTVISTIAQGRDITERRRAEQALRESEERMRVILDGVPDMILQVDTNLKVLWANKAARSMNPNIVDKFCYQALAGKERPCFGCPSARARETGQVEMGTVYHADFGGLPEGSYWESIGVPLRDSEGNITGVIEIARNVTKRKLAEEALEAANVELEVERETLKEKNIAMREILNQVDNERKQMVLQVQGNIDKIVVPILRKLLEKSGPIQKDYILLLLSSLAEVTSPFISKLETRYSRLAPREMEICNMIRKGMTSKEIASLLNSAEETVRNQRKNIRRKLGIANDKVNLRTFLQTV